MANFERKKLCLEKEELCSAIWGGVDTSNYVLYFPFQKSIKDYFDQTSSSTSEEYESGHIGYGLSHGTGMVSILPYTNLREYFKSAGDFSIDFWFLCDGSYYEEDSNFDIMIVSDSTAVFRILKEPLGSANYISLYDHNGYICNGFSLSNVLDGKFHHIALQLLKEQQSLRMFRDGIFYYEEPNVSFESYNRAVDTINFYIDSDEGISICIDEFRIMDGINFSEEFDPNGIIYPG